MNAKTFWVLGIGVLAATIIATTWAYPQLPDRVPTHWNWKGEIDGWGPKWMNTMISPGALVLMLVLTPILPRLSPKTFDIDRFRRPYYYIMGVIVLLFGYIHAVLLVASLHPKFDLSRFLVGGILASFALMGNMMGKLRRNFYMGIRVPWTLASERVWNETHRLGAQLFVLSGVIGLALLLAGIPPIWAMAPFVVAIVGPILYSYVLYKHLEREGKLGIDGPEST